MTDLPADELPRARVYLDPFGWNVQLGAATTSNVEWSQQDAFDYANLATKRARRQWHARGCKACHETGQTPDWSDWNAEYGEPRPKPCPDCQPREGVDD